MFCEVWREKGGRERGGEREILKGLTQTTTRVSESTMQAPSR
jgi:hypothetical protein